VESITGALTRAEKTRATSICNRSAITDYVSTDNHLIDWDNEKVTYQESDRFGRQIKKAIWTRKSSNINRGNKSYQLSHIWDSLINKDK